jgi:hypothetical protein
LDLKTKKSCIDYDNLISYIINSIHKWIADAVAHGKPIAAEPDEVDEFVPAREHKNSSFNANEESAFFLVSLIYFGENVLENVVGLQRQPA